MITVCAFLRGALFHPDQSVLIYFRLSPERAGSALLPSKPLKYFPVIPPYRTTPYCDVVID